MATTVRHHSVGTPRGLGRYSPANEYMSETTSCVFRKSVTDRFGIVTAEFGNVTGDFGNVTDGVFVTA